MADSNQQSTQSGTIIGSNDGLLTEILLRLPVSSIIRFKSVSKHWRWLLRQKHFTQRYDKLSKSPTVLIASNEYVPFDVENPSTPPFRCLDSFFDRPGVEIVQSCNGLLLCSTRLGPKGCKGAYKYYVCNPTTKQLALIPPVPGGLKAIWYMGLAFHQTECVSYKVICVLSVGPDVDSYQIQVYSSDTREWKISIQSFFSAYIPVLRQGVYWNGALYLVPLYDNRNYLYFKIDDQQLQTLPIPLGLISSEVVTMYLGESRGHLHLIAYKNIQEGMLRLNVYEMLSDHSGWFVKYQQQLDALPAAFLNMIYGPGYGFKIINVVRGEEEEDTFLVLKTLEKIITYNVHDRSFKRIYSLTRYCSSSFLSLHQNLVFFLKDLSECLYLVLN